MMLEHYRITQYTVSLTSPLNMYPRGYVLSLSVCPMYVRVPSKKSILRHIYQSAITLQLLQLPAFIVECFVGRHCQAELAEVGAKIHAKAGKPHRYPLSYPLSFRLVGGAVHCSQSVATHYFVLLRSFPSWTRITIHRERLNNS